MGEAGAIVGGHIDKNELRQELYVPTDEDDALSEFFLENYQQDGGLLIITGSAGDGKSALLSRAFKQARQAGRPIEQNHICMDATASAAKHETYDAALYRFLERISSNRRETSGPRTGLAINLGLAIDFFDRKGHAEEFQEIWNAIDAVRTQRTYVDEKHGIHVRNLSHRELFSTRPGELGDGLLRDIVEKFAFDKESSPFYRAYQDEKENCPDKENCPLFYNAQQFTKPVVRDRVTELIAAQGIINNTYLNPRLVLDILSSIILPQQMLHVDPDPNCPIGAATDSVEFTADFLLWNTIFERLSDPSDKTSGHIDPAAQSGVSLDQELLSWGADIDRLEEFSTEELPVNAGDVPTRIRTILRQQYLIGEPIESGAIETAVESKEFEEFLGALTYLNHSPANVQQETQLQQHVTNLLETVTQSLQGWSGSVTDSDYIEFVDGVKSTDYRFLSKWSRPDPDRVQSHRQTREETTPGQLWLVLQPEGAEVTVPVPVTFELYILMKQIQNGYHPNALDLERSEGMRLIQSRLSEFTNKQEQVRVVNKLNEELFRVEDSGFDTIEIKPGDN